MKSLSLSDPEDVKKIMDKQNESPEQETFGGLLKTIENHPSYDFVKKMMSKSFFYSMPYSLTKNPEPYCRHILDVVDHASALNQAWDCEIKPESLVMVIILMHMTHVGYNCQAKYIKKTVKSTALRQAGFKWSKNVGYDQKTADITLFETIIVEKIELSKQEYLSLAYLLLGVGNSKMGTIIEFSTNYVKRFMVI